MYSTVIFTYYLFGLPMSISYSQKDSEIKNKCKIITKYLFPLKHALLYFAMVEI